MAIDVGISKSIISGLKNGTKSFISLEVANKIANYFETTVDVVLNGTMQGNVEHELRGYREGTTDERDRVNEKARQHEADGQEAKYRDFLMSLCREDQEKFRLLQDAYAKNPEKTKASFDLFLKTL